MSKKKIDKLKKSVIASGAKQSPREEASFKWAYIFLFVFAIVLYANTLTHEFAFDDSVVITGNKYTQQGFAGIKTLATKDLFYGIYGSALDLELLDSELLLASCKPCARWNQATEDNVLLKAAEWVSSTTE